MPSTLYVVGTPIGNLEDLSPRAARVLGAVALVAAEDTRVTRRLLNRLGARPRRCQLQRPQLAGAAWRRCCRRWRQGDAALVSDAGMPGISDPGRELVAAAAARGIRVESAPGPSAVTTALAVSGLPADAFRFLGFLPRRRRERQERLREAAACPDTVVLFEAPSPAAGRATGHRRRLRPATHRRLPRADQAPRGSLSRHCVRGLTIFRHAQGRICPGAGRSGGGFSNGLRRG